MSHTPIFVLDQDSAKDFYCSKLGFEERMDVTMDGGFRWLTVAPPGQPDLEIILMPTTPSEALNDSASAKLRELIQSGAMGAGVFHVDDCHATYEELKAKGVEFAAPPEDKFYGIEAIIQDDSGNWFSMTQPKM